ncbi:MAG: ribosome biogenesis GTPase Der [Bacteroidales bacterium]|jgi:GTP-binding protein|nr:ribosome biogenesis GTPase Der [Bacteroidales bacterium]HOL98168.1 ribosome biogenesis GTPase Der [Bacteroidales bacterium]HOM36526.1 ribosome biogenesis GTPase Der [Bacteroidales bacterium]HPD23934.1 ribosome biogenesis GTPase Der [Bacteroidales bacterium]HRS99914.1 ribosome biogenesis GTPase Der [Bacteroidales bacterium]
MGNLVAIVGRPNVGKSTLFNRLTERREAIVDDVSGVTRDRIYGHCEWNGKIFSVVDTGGYVADTEDIFEKEIARQVEIAIEEADQIIFLTDVTTGITDMDKSVAELLRKSQKPVFIAVNKVDNNIRLTETYEFYNLGLGEIYPISSINGSGTGELLDEICKNIRSSEESDEENIPKITIVGRPNVGKSSLTNSLLGENRNIVTDIAGTTRDSIRTRYNKFGFDFWLIDTAGVRRKSKVREDIEFYSVMRAIRAIEHSDVCLLMIDATIGFEAQDQNILNIIRKNKKGIVLIVNKWDLVQKNTNTARDYTNQLKQILAPFNDIPILFTSAINNQRIFKVVEEAMRVYNNLKQKISTSKLNEYLLDVIESYPPPAYKGKYIKIKYVTQLPTPSPTFAFFVNLPQYIKEPYKRYLENKIRENYDFCGVPISLVFRPKSK